jgi:hypothetical protein
MSISLTITANTAAELWSQLLTLAQGEPVTVTVVSDVSTGPIKVDAVAPIANTARRGRPKKPDAALAQATAGDDKSAQAPVAASDPKTEAPAATSTPAEATSTETNAEQGSSAPEASVPTLDEVRAAGMRFLEKNKETPGSCPKFKALLKKYSDDLSFPKVPVEKRAELISECDA